MGVPFPISPSMLKTYDTCPRQFKAKYKDKTIPYKPSIHTEFGNAVHSNIETYIRSATPLHPKLEPLKPILDRMKTKSCTAELKLAIGRDHKPADYFDNKRAWLRLKIDLLVMYQNWGLAIDWKTGKPSEQDWIQDDVTKLVVAKNYPPLSIVKSHFSYLFKGGSTTTEFRQNEGSKMIGIYQLTSELDKAWDTNTFPEKQSGLCRAYCDVLDCPFNGKNKA